ncbi:MAG: polysaccharide deacetylase family protein [Actinomycetota bacterium]
MGDGLLSRARTPLVCAAGLLLRLTGRRAGLVLVYHGLEEQPGDSTHEIVIRHGIALFERQLRHLRRWYRVVDSREILAAVQDRRRGGRFPVAITFDDDLRSHAQTALPILRRRGLRATFFLCGASLETPFSFWWERLQRALDTGDARIASALPGAASLTARELAERVKRLDPDARDAFAAALDPGSDSWAREQGMPAEHVGRLVAGGMTIGFHTRRHDPLDGLDDARLADALRSGREQLDALAGAALDEIAYPHGVQDERVVTAAREAGFAVGFSVDGRAVGSGDDPLQIPRLVPRFESPGRFALQLVRRLRRG